MMKLIGFILGLLFFTAIGWNIYSSYKLNEQKTQYDAQIDSLQHRIDSLNQSRTRFYSTLDSLQQVNRTLVDKYKSSELNYGKIKDSYDKIRNNLNSYTVDEHIVFFAEHISPKDSH